MPQSSPFYHPRYWPTWLGLGVLYLTAKLPYTWQLAIGRQLGKLSYHLLRRRRHIAAVNLQLCFPELTPPQRQTLLRESFASLGIGVIETGMAWWMTESRLQKLVHIEGLEHLDKALQKGNGVILLCAHFTTLEITARLAKPHFAAKVIYRKQKNLLFNNIMEQCRKRNTAGIIDRQDMRGILKTLKSNIPIYYAADQDYSSQHSIFAPFFGVQAATVTAIARLAELTKAVVVPLFHYRLEGKSGYRISFQPGLDAFPTENLAHDMTRINQILEQAIRAKPEQYLWIHRRFKTRPAGETRPY